jgi:hypothetical protein
VEFALALPILLLLMFGIIEFGRLMQAWLALENGARFAVRYAITGQYNLEYCEEAGIALGYTDLDNADHKIDCIIPETYPDGPNKDVKIPDFDLKTIELQDYARLPTIRENALAGASGIALDEQPAVSGDYLSYLDNAYDVNGDILSQLFRGNPTAPGYFGISTCSNHKDILTYAQLNPNGFWYDEDPADGIPPVETDANRFPIYCQEVDTPTNNLLRYIDDAGGPGDRVRIILTYRHELITPFLSNWWPTLKLTTSREGIVEKFRTSRVTGLTGGISMAATKSYTPSDTFTPSDTLEASLTPSNTFTATYTPTPTNTSTPTQASCANTGSILRQWWSNLSTTDPSVNSLINQSLFPYLPTGGDYPVTFTGPTNWADGYGQRFRGYVCAPYDGWYKFWIVSDDNSKLYLSSDTNPLNINPTPISYVNNSAAPLDWNDGDVIPSTDIYLYAGQEYYTEALHKEAGGNDNLAVGWKGPNDLNNANPQVIAGKYLRPFIPETVPTPEDCANTGSLLRQRWNSIDGNPVSNLTSNPRYPGNASSWQNFGPFEIIDNSASFGERWRGYICPPFDGQYTFYIASDDYSELYLSTDTNPANMVKIAYVNGWTTLHNYTASTSQKSVSKTLQGGTRYYVEALWKQGGGSGNLSVAWIGPNLNPLPSHIDSQYLIPIAAEPTLTYTVTNTFTPSSTFTKSLTPSNTFTRTNTPTITNTSTITNTATITLTPSRTYTLTQSLTPSNTFTRTSTPTKTETLTPSNTPTSTNTFTLTNTSTNTSTQTNTPSRTSTFTPSVTLTPSITLTPSSTYTPTTYISPTIWGGG